jgi:hypothetical protein
MKAVRPKEEDEQNVGYSTTKYLEKCNDRFVFWDSQVPDTMACINGRQK